MKKKSIFVVALAALMLIAFTACEQQMPTYKNVSFITVSQLNDVIIGQPFDASNYEVTVHYTDNSTEVFPGNGRVTTESTDFTKAYDVTAAIGSGTSAVSDTIEVTPVAPTAVAVTATAKDYSRVDATIAVDLMETEGAVTVTSYTYSVGSVSYTSTTKLDKIALSAEISKEQRSTVGTYDIPFEATYAGKDIACESTVSVKVVDTTTVGAPTAMKAFYKVNNGTYSTTAPAKAYIGDTVSVELRIVDSQEKTVAIVDTTKLTLLNGSAAFIPTYTITGTAGTAVQDFLYTYTYTDSNDKEQSVTYTAKVAAMPAGDKYVADAAAFSALTVKEAKKADLKGNVSFDGTNNTNLSTFFDFTVKYNDGSAVESTDLDTYVTLPHAGSAVVAQKIPADAETFTLYYEIHYGVGEGAKTELKSVTFDVAE